MSLSLVLALQAAAAATPVSPAPRWAMPEPTENRIDFDLNRYQSPASDCLGAGAGDVLVCGPRRGGGAYPMARWARIFGPEPPIRAEMDLGGGVQGRIYSEAVAMDRGAVSNRAMVGIKVPF